LIRRLAAGDEATGLDCADMNLARRLRVARSARAVRVRRFWWFWLGHCLLSYASTSSDSVTGSATAGSAADFNSSTKFSSAITPARICSKRAFKVYKAESSSAWLRNGGSKGLQSPEAQQRRGRYLLRRQSAPGFCGSRIRFRAKSSHAFSGLVYDQASGSGPLPRFG
jgi:hypothetical protein